MIRELPPLAEVGGEQPLHQRVLVRGPPRGLGEPVGVERAARAAPASKSNVNAHLRPERGQLRVAGPDLFGAHAVLAPQALLLGALDCAPAHAGRSSNARCTTVTSSPCSKSARATLQPGQARAHTTGTRSRTTHRSACAGHPRGADEALLRPVLLRPALGRGHERPAGGAVDGLADDVGVSGVAGHLLNEVQQDPAGRPDDAARDPRDEVDRGRQGCPRGPPGRPPSSRCSRAWSPARAITSSSVSPSTRRNPSDQSSYGGEHGRCRPW